MGNDLLFYLAGVPVLGLTAQWIAWRFRLPSILLLLAFGVALGQFVDVDQLLAEQAHSPEASSVGPNILFPIVSLAVAVILFEGGLTLRVRELKHSWSVVLRLCVIGVLISWVMTAMAAYWILDLRPEIAALIGAILVVTGPTVIAPLLRHIKPNRRIGSIVKWEGIVIDPIGAVLAVLVFGVISGHGGFPVFVLLYTVFIGLILGLLVGGILVQLVKRYWIPDFLQGVGFLAITMAVFAISNGLQKESGLVTVTILGIYLANQRQASIQHVIEFKEHLTVLLVSCLFIVLGSRINLSQFADLGLSGLGFLLAMILVVRPMSVILAMIGSETSWQERFFLSFLAPRGIVAAAVTTVFALEIQHVAAEDEGLSELAEQARQMEPLTFLVIVGTVAVYGLSAGPLAKSLKLAEANPQGILFAGAEPWVQKIAKVLFEESFQVLLVDTNFRNTAAARMEGLPAECASILSEHVREELDLGGIGRMLAVTANDEVNALAASEMAPIFGRANVYQLPPWDAGSGPRESVSEHLRGREAFGGGLHHDKIANLMKHGHDVKKTRITDEFTYQHFQEMYGDSAILMFVINESGTLTVCERDVDVSPKAGDTVISLVQAPAEEQA